MKMSGRRAKNAGFVLPLALTLVLSVCVVLGGTLAYVLGAARLSAAYAQRDACRLAAMSALEKVRGAVYLSFKKTAADRALLFHATAFHWFNSWSATTLGNGATQVDFDDVLRDLTPSFGDFTTLRVRLRGAPQADGSRAVVTFYATAEKPLRNGRTVSVTLAERVAFGVDRSKVFDHAYFVNNYGWFEGSTITANGNVRANGDMSLSQSPKINGHVYAARNAELNVPGEIRNGTGTMDNRATYASTQYGTSNRARPLQQEAGDGGYDAPENVTAAAREARLHGTLEEGLDMPWISDLDQYVEYARSLHATLSVGNEVKIGPNDGCYNGAGPSGDPALPDNGALVLEGTLAEPIRLNGPVVVSNDVVIKGYVTGQGTIYSARNIHIVGNIQYVNPPDWTGKQAPAGNSNATKDLLGLAARGNIVMGDCTASGWMSSTLKRVLTTSPYVQPYTCARAENGAWLDADIGYPKAGQTQFGGNYTVADGGTKVSETQKPVYKTETYQDRYGRTQTRQVQDGYTYTYSKNTQRTYYDSVVAPHEISSRAETITQIDAVLYNNHGIFGNLGSCTINGSLVCRNEGMVFNGKLFLNWDSRLFSGSPESVANSLVGMPVSTAAPDVLAWWEAPDEQNGENND